MAIFGIAAYDISSDRARGHLNDELKGFAVKATESVLMFDWSLKDKVMQILRKWADPVKDQVFEAQRFNEDDAEQSRAWVRKAAQKFYDEVALSLRRTVERAERELDSAEIGVLDLMDRVADADQRARTKIDDFMMALATFRLDGEYESYKTAYIAKIEATRASADAIVAKNSSKLTTEVAALNAAVKAEAEKKTDAA